jgi:hypothetical protein
MKPYKLSALLNVTVLLAVCTHAPALAIGELATNRAFQNTKSTEESEASKFISQLMSLAPDIATDHTASAPNGEGLYWQQHTWRRISCTNPNAHPDGQDPAKGLAIAVTDDDSTRLECHNDTVRNMRISEETGLPGKGDPHVHSQDAEEDLRLAGAVKFSSRGEQSSRKQEENGSTMTTSIEELNQMAMGMIGFIAGVSHRRWRDARPVHS